MQLARLVAARPQLRHVVLIESLGPILLRREAAGFSFHLSEVKGAVMDRLQRSSFLEHLTGDVFLGQYQAMARLDPATASRAAQAVLPAAPGAIKIA